MTKHNTPAADRRIVLVLDRDLDDALVNFAIENKLTIAAVVQSALVAFLDPGPRNVTLPPAVAWKIQRAIAGSGVTVQQFVIAAMAGRLQDAESDPEWKRAMLCEAVHLAEATHV